MTPCFYEFFAGGGMARAGLGEGWRCVLANDIDRKKAAAYAANWGAAELKVGSVGHLTPADAPGRADLAWASFPCQDLSLAGGQVGLRGARSGALWLFWKLMLGLAAEKRAPAIVVLENVCGALTSHGGADFVAIGEALAKGGYRFGALVIDAVHFVPQSRPRLFIVAVRKGRKVERGAPDPLWHPASLTAAYERLPAALKSDWVWWTLPSPPARGLTLADLIQDEPEGVRWHSPEETDRLIAMMTPRHRQKLDAATRLGGRAVGGIYRRTRGRVQRAEIRFDVAGCLRTPAGGSSRQTLLIVEGDAVRSRLLSPREAARLMGLPDTYKLPASYNEAYHLVGDGVVAPVVRFLAAHLLEPLAR